MTTKQILYFDRSGSQNTEALIGAVKERVQELEIEHVVVASVSGQTGIQLWEALQGTGCTVISVTEHAGFHGKDEIPLAAKKREEMENKGIKTLIATHALSGVGRSISRRFGGTSPVEIIAHTLRRFGGDGIKVAVEVSIMAADAGLLPTNREIIAVGGTHAGADAAIVLKTAHMNNFFDLEIREIIAKSRQR
uniref:Pyruvate kinase C-terminal domain-containing protein n=1 Tax=Candidatus Kentrum sp. FM TaxID=2126340 RepID=A0A450VWD9_9GAMM|nr:MAG: hypothetical protein BECKFM1743C_GA0114222_101041 [Candidatus Kentron sp. FM]VFJ66680.1 MAG: hypothetical protein BECKFM1743A_GA0114220_104221 [Candidatus Kentron sp. FM]VFK09016.1 MAG: hypothetical protein BECKFM1743B_GA0114221_100922 [Candidatus Kentron sp. FM]